MVIPFFFFTGILLERIYAAVEEFDSSTSNEYHYTKPFGSDELVLQAFDERLQQVQDGTGNMNCQLCKYRKQIIGFEEEKGKEQVGHHLNVKGILFEEDDKVGDKKGIMNSVKNILGI